MITYTRQADDTWLKQGEFAYAPAEVRIQIGDGKPMSSTYTLQAAQALIEDAIAKKQVKQDVYRILPMDEKLGKPSKPEAVLTEADEARVAEILADPVAAQGLDRKAAIKQLRKEQKAAGKPVRTPKAKKYSNEKFVEIYQTSNNSLDEVCKQTGASRVWAQRVLVKLGVYVKPIKEAKPEVVLTPEEDARVGAIIAASTNVEGVEAQTAVENGQGILTRAQAIKQLRKEQRVAARPAREAKGPRVTKYSKQDFVDTYLANHSLDEVCTKTGASRVWAQRVLVQQGVWVAPVKAAKPAADPTPAPSVLPAAKPAKPAKAPKAAKPAKTPAVKAPKAPKPAAAPKAPKATKKAKATAEVAAQ